MNKNYQSLRSDHKIIVVLKNNDDIILTPPIKADSVEDSQFGLQLQNLGQIFVEFSVDLSVLFHDENN